MLKKRCFSLFMIAVMTIAFSITANSIELNTEETDFISSNWSDQISEKFTANDIVNFMAMVSKSLPGTIDLNSSVIKWCVYNDNALHIVFENDYRCSDSCKFLFKKY